VPSYAGSSSVKSVAELRKTRKKITFIINLCLLLLCSKFSSYNHYIINLLHSVSCTKIPHICPPTFRQKVTESKRHLFKNLEKTFFCELWTPELYTVIIIYQPVDCFLIVLGNQFFFEITFFFLGKQLSKKLLKETC